MEIIVCAPKLKIQKGYFRIPMAYKTKFWLQDLNL